MKTNDGYRKRLWLTSVSTAAIICMATAPAARAQTTSTTTKTSTQTEAKAPASSGQLEEVVVTARKRSEQLLKVPVAITAFTSKTLKTRGIYSIGDLAKQTAGLTSDTTAGTTGRSDRSFPEFVIRGMVPSVYTNPTTTVFLDGAPLISGEVDGLENLERVEVLKGPQSAYFGRETFAGAINLVTKDPSAKPQVTLDSLLGTGNWSDQNIGIQGPIVPGKLSFSGNFRDYSRQGSYENKAAGDKTKEYLGDQSTKSGNFTIVLTPNDKLKVKVLGLYFHDDDGPSAQEEITPDQSNCLDGSFCGTVPGRLSTQPAVNDLVTPSIQRFLNHLGTAAGNQVFKPMNTKYGLVRDGYHGSVNVDYNFDDGITATSLSAIDLQKFSSLQDFSDIDGSSTANPYYALTGNQYGNSYYDYPFFAEEEYRSTSQELRLTSDASQRFRWLVGFDYQYTRTDSSLGGGGGGLDYFAGDSPVTSNTEGVFYGLAYDILPRLTFNFEGRVQTDTESTSPNGTSQTVSGTYNNFLPRLTLQYKFTPKIMGYATYSEGVNPGEFNGGLLSLPAAEQKILAADYNATVKVLPEKLTNYELGAKGSFFNDSLQVSADVYYDIWKNQIDSNTILFQEGGVTETQTVYTNNGRTNLMGLEADTEWEPVNGLVLNGSGAINDSHIESGGCYACSLITGTQNVDGNQLPDVSLYQISVGAQYNGHLTFLGNTPLSRFQNWGYFDRFDYTYKSPQYEDKDNIVSTPAENLINLRVGVSHGPLTIEAFVDNLTNFSGPTSLSGYYNVGNPRESFARQDALVGGLPYLRSFGLRLRYSFGL
jgi:iron complex outermembrane receptor protein